MAIDGVKIIDSDIAHDVYNVFMDLYDANVDLEKIKEKVGLWRREKLDDVDFEIFITSYALVLWETGNLTDEIHQEAKSTVQKGAVAKLFLEKVNEAESNARQKEVDKLLAKLGTPNTKPRKRKISKTLSNFLLEIDSVVVFKMPDNTYSAAIMVNIRQDKGKCYYQFTPTAYSGVNKPTVSDIERGKAFIHKIESGFDRETLKANQPGIEKFWLSDKTFNAPFTIGIPVRSIEHKDLINFIDQFEVVGTIKIADSFKKAGSAGYESSYDKFIRRFIDTALHQPTIFKLEIIDLRDIL
jgi:hypothetical protein